MERTLAVCVPKHREAMASLLSSCGCGPVLFAQSAGEARRRLLEGEFQLVVINAPLPDEFGRTWPCRWWTPPRRGSSSS